MLVKIHDFIVECFTRKVKTLPSYTTIPILLIFILNI